MPSQASNVRRAAVSALRAWAKGHTYMDSLIERHAGRNSLSRQDRALLQSIVYAVLRHRRLLDHWIGKLRRGKLDHETRDVLRVGLCQLLILRIADHAVVNETVNCAKTPVRGLINAVLRQAIVRRKRLMDEMDDLPPALQYSHPDWLYNRWRKAFGKQDAIALMQWDNQPAAVLCRVNELKEGARETVYSYEKSTPVDGLDGFYQVDGLPPGEWMKEGLIYIQDPATRHCVELLAPQPGERVLDACAAPGGKSTMIAVAMQNRGEILCTDSNEKRLPRLEENLANLGVTIAKSQAHDWTTPAPAEWHGQFDAILLDVPCSNTGVLRRRIDARWRLRLEDIEELTQIQEKILTHALPCLKPGGRIVYSTCSIDAEENRGLMDAFVAKHPEWKLDAEHQALPFRDDSDGAYAARLVRGSSI
ncbi:16S rRNA (cytosine(967)-C(5))-methyltransferase RsmB [Verrucomicrobiaceae bacterium 5K15]|uniref:16S rRNA (cytosine(967)-C(5))-methyltransferase n=1 Tax=Oceaniferula flava TaxID=2800421 RepID=A0AAE2VBI1_9BACT|nr:16S rRNA (cytosine(967)-C(5))-methyltransferase RsmB [Oceaniferula flavus]MBK1853796.1 16S rRNA (cytosine(967)-C(5))-methyltransferase RsmB [Oceaniferula flavus]MBM1135102.1 16S rRNA (cytosine(967)-C(5))-methyltransferase RsmB [Oceaniferula flavus]